MIKSFSDYKDTPESILEIDSYIDGLIEENNIKSIDDINESIIGKIMGGTTGFLLGPVVGKIICKVLGIKDGPVYDLLTSRLVSTAIGIAIAKELGGEYRKK